MSALLVVVTLLAQALLLGVIVAVVVLGVWVLWDCAAGPSAEIARKNRARGGAGR